jgi:hypothetical protein
MTRRRLRTIAASLLLLVTTIALAVWFTLSASIPARGDFHGFALDTTVDSESARYYVESYAQGSADDPQLHDAIDTLKRDFGDRIPNHVDLRLVAQARSVDFAALFFAAQLLSLDQNAAINDLFRVHVDRALREEVTIERSDDITVVLVPGYDYEENGRAAGADLQEQVAILRTLGFRVAFVDVDPIGTVMESAAVISRALEELAPTQVVIAGPSSAGPAIQAALSRLDPASGVLAWLNLGAHCRASRCSTGFKPIHNGWPSTLSSGRRTGDTTALRASQIAFSVTDSRNYPSPRTSSSLTTSA